MIDIFFLILCFVISYSALRCGFLIEIFKLAGLLLSTILAFQFYPFLSGFLEKHLAFLHKQFLNFVAFGVIFFSVSIGFYLLEKLVGVFIKAQELSARQRLISLTIGGARLILLISTLLFLIFLFPGKFTLTQSVSYRLCKQVAPKVYLVSFKIYNKCIPNMITLNGEVKKYYEIKDNLSGDSKKGT